MRDGIHRRTVLKAIATAVAAVPVSTWTLLPSTAHAHDADASLRDILLRLCPDARHAVTVGRCYIDDDPVAPSSVQRLRQWLEPCGDDAVRVGHAFRARRAADFARGDSVVVDGWVLARCEADLCAAIVLLRQA